MEHLIKPHVPMAAREELLKTAGLAEAAHLPSLRLAQTVCTAENAQTLFEKLSGAALRRKNQITASMVALAVVFLAVSAANSAGFYLLGPLTDFHGLIWFGLATTATVAMLLADMRAEQEQAAQLVPIKGTDMCRTALRYVEQGAPSVLAWRDIAVSERGQLYAFDLEVMSALHDFALETETDEEKDRLNEEAAMKLQGLMPAPSM